MTTRRIVAAAMAAGFVIRLAFAFGYWVGKPLTHDETEYLVLARNLAEGRGFTYETGEASDAGAEHFGRVPGYPFFIVLVTGGQVAIDEVPPALKVAQSAIGAIGVGILAMIAGAAAGPAAAVTAAVIAAVYPPLVWICAYALSEAFYSVVVLLSALLLTLGAGSATPSKGARRPSTLLTVLAGAVAGIGVLTRPATLIFVALAVPWLLVRRQLSLAAALLVGAAVVIAPWTARNIREYDRFVLVSSQGGVTFWTGNNPIARGEGDMAANPAIKRYNAEIRAAYPSATPEEMEPIYWAQAWAFIREHPLSWLWLMLRKFFYTWVPIGPSYTLHSTLYYATSVIAYGAVVPFAAAGFLKLRRSTEQPWPLWLLTVSAVLVCLIFFPQERFRLPVIDPALIVCASACALGPFARRHAT